MLRCLSCFSRRGALDDAVEDGRTTTSGILALRVESVELEKRLQQARDRLATVRQKQQQRSPSSSSRIVSTIPAWRHIARRHLRARQEAESENRRLREQLVDHLKWGNALQAKMNARGCGNDPNSARAAATAAALGSVANPLLLAEDEEGITDLELELDDTDRAELEMLAIGLDAAYARVDEVFMDHKVTEVSFGSVSGSRKTLDGAEQEGGMAAVELRDSRVIPFEFRLAIDAAWNAWVLWHLGGSCRKSVSAHRSCSYPDVSRPEHTFAVKFRLQTPASQLPTGAGPMFLDLKLVLRRYVEQNRLVLVWRGLSAGEKDLDGLFTDETGWVLFEEMQPFPQTQKDDGIAAAAARTSMRSCVRMTPKRAEECTATPTQGQVLANLVVNSYEEDVSFIYREMEAQLLRMTRHT
ncbi:hypothetical protein ON010_g6312 [Phytophthora cinnamomi]|nr:hypothetical protein ON010_g6312 [Phytophthora cinnamomi]